MTGRPGGDSRYRFEIGLATLVVAWLVVSCLYALRFPLIADEFQGAHSAAKLLELLPYRDFQPYKTVLGYVAQLPPLAMVADPWSALMAVRLEMVALGGIGIASLGVTLRRDFRPGAVLVGVFVLAGSTTFLERAGELRVDMLTAWVGVASLLCLLRSRWAWAGALAALSFFVSQKGAYFAVAGGVGILAALAPSGPRALGSAALRYIAAGLAIAGVYLIGWTLIAGSDEVVRTVFVGPAQLAAGDVYRDVPSALRIQFWWDSIRSSPALYLLALGGLGTAAASWSRATHLRALLGYATALIILYAAHRQPWPYYIATLAPTLAVLSIVAADRLMSTDRTAPFRRVALLVVLVLGLLPLLEVPANLSWTNDHQASTIRRMALLMEPDDRYLAGVHLLPRGDQEPAELVWLDRRATARIAEQSPAEISALAETLRETPLKLFVHTAQISELPLELQNTLLSDYLMFEPYLYMYAPTLLPGASPLTLHFTGRYLLEAAPGATARIGTAEVGAGDVIDLEAGSISVEVQGPARLRFLPASPPAGPRERPPLPFFSRSVFGTLTTWADAPTG